MRIEHQNSSIEFELNEIIDVQGRHDISCNVKSFCDGFAGEVSSVWFSGHDIDSFIERLEGFNQIRQGSVELHNMSSGSDANELEFRIFATEKLGHLAVHAKLQKLIYFKDFSEISTVSIIFEFDPSLLKSIINEFKKLFKV